MLNSTGILKYFVTLTCVSAAAVLLGACGKQDLESVEVKSMTDPYLWMEEVLGDERAKTEYSNQILREFPTSPEARRILESG